MVTPRETAPPLVSVVTNAHNAERHIGEALESIRRQTFEDWEHVVVDDASTDRTADVVDRFVRSDPRFRMIRRDERGGAYVAANEGFRAARGRYVARLDADDVSKPERLERQLAFLGDRPALRACATNVDLLIDGRVEEMKHIALPVLPGALKWRACVREMPFPSTTLVERRAWADVGGFRELAYSQDFRFWCDLARRRWLGLLPEALVYWRRHTDQVSSAHSQQQEELGLDALRDHLAALGEVWDAVDVYRLRWAGSRPVGLRRGSELLGRFERMWRRDATLDAAEIAELTEMMAHLRRRHRRVNIKNALASRRWVKPLLNARARRHWVAR